MLLKRVTHRNCSRERCRPPFLKAIINPFIYAFSSFSHSHLFLCVRVITCAKGVAHLKTSKISGSVAEWMASRLHAWFPAKGAYSLQGGVTGCKASNGHFTMTIIALSSWTVSSPRLVHATSRGTAWSGQRPANLSRRVKTPFRSAWSQTYTEASVGGGGGGGG